MVPNVVQAQPDVIRQRTVARSPVFPVLTTARYGTGTVVPAVCGMCTAKGVEWVRGIGGPVFRLPATHETTIDGHFPFRQAADSDPCRGVDVQQTAGQGGPNLYPVVNGGILMIFRDRMQNKLSHALSPVFLDIRDDSARHAGHADRITALQEKGADGGHAPIDDGGETHFTITVISSAFEGKNRIERQRMVYDLLADELRERVHALSVTARTPGEFQGL